MRKRLPVGVDNYAEMLTGGYTFVDRTLLIRDFIDGSDKVVLTLRPRRWGKTLTLTMLHAFLSPVFFGRNTHGLFDHSAIAKVDEGGFLAEHQGKYPVIFVNLKKVKETRMEDFLENMTLLIQAICREHQELTASDKLTEAEKIKFHHFLTEKLTCKELEESLFFLSELLHKHTGQPVYILIDEYDTPMNSVYENNDLFHDITLFFKMFFGNAFKTNPHLAKGLMTGILRLSKNHMLSDLNNLKVYSAFDTRYSEYYGFSEEEVRDLFRRCGLEHQIEKVKKWYNGYYSGDRIAYNPWSIILCLDAGGELKPYWVLSGDDSLIQKFFQEASPAIKDQFRQLLAGNAIQGTLSDTMRFTDHVGDDATALWTLLFYTGYVKAHLAPPATEELSAGGGGGALIVSGNLSLRKRYELSLPNLEVSLIYKDIFAVWAEETWKQYTGSKFAQDMSRLGEGDITTFMAAFNQFLLASASVRDLTDEGRYHMLLLGSLGMVLPSHDVKSNQEHGRGYPDILLLPVLGESTLGVVLELKHLKDPPGRAKEWSIRDSVMRLQQESQTGLDQINSRSYHEAFRAISHIKTIFKVGLAFYGKLAVACYQTLSSETSEETDLQWTAGEDSLDAFIRTREEMEAETSVEDISVRRSRRTFEKTSAQAGGGGAAAASPTVFAERARKRKVTEISSIEEDTLEIADTSAPTPKQARH